MSLFDTLVALYWDHLRTSSGVFLPLSELSGWSYKSNVGMIRCWHSIFTFVVEGRSLVGLVGVGCVGGCGGALPFVIFGYFLRIVRTYCTR